MQICANLCKFAQTLQNDLSGNNGEGAGAGRDSVTRDTWQKILLGFTLIYLDLVGFGWIWFEKRRGDGVVE
jgi:hypothetical protein